MRRFIALHQMFALAAAMLAGCAAPDSGRQSGHVGAQGEAATPPEASGPAGPGGRAGLMRFGAGGGSDGAFENRLITNVLQHSFTAHGADFDPHIDAAGQFVVFASTRNSERPDIFMKGVDGYAITQLSSDPADDIQPRFSPDGTRIAFASNRSGNWDVWVIGRDGTELTQLTRDQADEVAPCWSPDGQRIAFCTWGRRSQQWEIWEIGLSEPGVRRFLAFGMFPDWSPDGRFIAFQRARQRDSRWFSIWTIELVGGEVRHPTEVVYSDEAACVAPHWSPDGKRLVYCAITGGREGSGAGTTADLWAVETISGQRWKLTDGSSPAFNPVWASNERVFFVSPRAGSDNIWSVSAPGRVAAERAEPGPAHGTHESGTAHEMASGG
ncbi:MAG: hypothetical protein LC135_03760 [Phycisphaerae bacterium]|nr:PD40 domain-containing protein [Phycisphaerae bacterium]MCZ2398969.1 hypothetical protein [Phycisphaerae bacterium]